MSQVSTPKKKAPRVLRRSEDRRPELVDAALVEFARKGLYGTPTTAIAARAGISQAYLFRLFPTKEDLFIACVEQAYERVRDELARAGEPHRGDPEAALDAMGDAYDGMLEDGTMLANQLHSYAACQEPAVREAVQENFGAIVETIREVSGASDEAVQAFVAHGMLMNVIGAIGVADSEAPWARALRCEEEA
ncbi:MAG: TetR/AcrR family transcriptional regulator [Solirubrobacterales bacterium]